MANKEYKEEKERTRPEGGGEAVNVYDAEADPSDSETVTKVTETVEDENPKSAFSSIKEQVDKTDNVIIKTIWNFFKPERIIGIITLLLIPCLMAQWIVIPAGEQFGITLKFSAPEAFSTGSKIVADLEEAGSVFDEVENTLNQATEFLKEANEMIGALSSVLNTDPTDYKNELSSELSSTVNSVVDTSTDVGAEISEEVTAAGNDAINESVDEISNQIEETGVTEYADDINDNMDIATDSINTTQNAVNEVQTEVKEVKETYNSTLDTAKTVLSVVSFAWYLFLVLIFVAGVLLVAGIRGRYVTSIIALAISFIASAGTAAGIIYVNDLVLNIAADMAGAWILTIVPTVITTTIWPWATAAISGVSLVGVCVLLARKHKEKKMLQHS